MNRTLLREFRKVARYLGVPLTDLRGSTLRDLFEELESPGVTIGWDSWTDAELDMML